MESVGKLRSHRPGVVDLSGAMGGPIGVEFPLVGVRVESGRGRERN